MENRTAEEIKIAKDFLNKLYGIGDEDHTTGLETGHYLGAISDLINQNKALIEAFFKYLCNDADVIIEAYEDLEPENINNIIENFFFEIKPNKK